MRPSVHVNTRWIRKIRMNLWEWDLSVNNHVDQFLCSHFACSSSTILVELLVCPVKEVELSNVVKYEGCFRATYDIQFNQKFWSGFISRRHPISLSSTLPCVKTTLRGTRFYFDLIISRSSYQSHHLNQLFSDQMSLRHN